MRDPLVGIEDEAPRRFGQRQRRVARSGEVVAPLEVRDARAHGAGNLRRRVARPGVQHDHFVDPRAGAREATPEAARLVADDHDESDALHAGRAGGRLLI